MFALVVLMILPPAATAATGADPSNPSLDQYVESVPSSHGGGPPAGRPSRGHLSDSVRHEIASRGGVDAKQLEALATSSAFGAPTTTSTQSSSAASGTRAAGAGGGSGAGRAPLAIADHRPSGLNAITTAATDGEGSSVGVLAAGLLLITALLGATTLARRRSHAL